MRSTCSIHILSDTYLVVLNSAISDDSFDSHLRRAGVGLSARARIKHDTFSIGGFKGYTVRASNATIAALAESTVVDYIERDQLFSISFAASPDHIRRKRDIQGSAPWNLGRISHTELGSTDYVYQPTNVETYIYVLDTGVKVTHSLFQGRASCGFDVFGGSCDDLQGHGTHLAGIAGADHVGVSRSSKIISVKILADDGSGSTPDIIKGISWAMQDVMNKGREGKAIALLATNAPSTSKAINTAIASASNAGLMFAVPAGDKSEDARLNSPASEPTACTVGATNDEDYLMSQSNFGAGVDIQAPGQQILSLSIASNTAVVRMSGTAMAAAHIAGLGAYLLAIEGPRSAAALCAHLKMSGTMNALRGGPVNTVNIIAYNWSGL